ncbi:MAG: phenylalanine--tRNA ligase subunit alpha [candidate division WOR-3 bacterium]|nr:phenylalanine--tRNA ligase subunit alpha [candidate division WOR-3 bacterium]
MNEKLKELFSHFESEYEQSKDDLKALGELRVKYLGKKSELKEMLSGIGSIEDREDRKQFGKDVNILKNRIEKTLKDRIAHLEEESASRKNESEFDVTTPVFINDRGSLHPIEIVQRELERILTGMGFTIVTGPEMDTEYYNFEALNIPEDHPARDMQDTFWLSNGKLLRTQTSTCQVHAMEKYGAPLRIISPGKCFRYEAMDASHENTFYQMEGLLIDRDITVGHLIGTMKTLLSEIFHEDVEVRLRPGYFPFVEPGFELDIRCLICGGRGCSTCSNSGWLELMPCGMVHPNVLEMSGIDSEQFNGFAFGLGLTRLAMMKFNIHDIRLLNSGDLRFLRQFRN